LFPRVVIAAPCRDAAPPPDCLAFSRLNISIEPQAEAGGDTVAAKLKLLASLPKLVVGLSRAMHHADAIHVRCPGNLGLIGAALGPLFSRPLVAKYAGQWNGFPREPLSGRLERYILGSRWWSAPVTVYGTWPNQPSHVVPFFTSMMGSDQVQHAVDVAEKKRIEKPLRVLFSGMLEPRKRVDVLLAAAKILRDQQVPIQLAIVGDGAQRDRLMQQVTEWQLGSCVRFVGATRHWSGTNGRTAWCCRRRTRRDGPRWLPRR
jgi:glycosyltransferase involved in cell wall biosynthesis